MRQAPANTAAEPVDETPDRLTVAFTLCARLCHDLAGTVGALSGALDMAAAGQDPDALALAADCARELSARLRLLRATWTESGETDEPGALVAGLPGSERLTVDLSGLDPELSDAPRRLSANLLLLAAQSLPRGGTIRLSGSDAELSLQIDGLRAAWPPALARCLAEPDWVGFAAGSDRTVGVAVLCLLACRLGLRVVQVDSKQLVVR